MLTETQVKIILVLRDNEGHAGWELARILEMEDSNLNPILKKLMKLKIIRRGKIRKSRNIWAKNPGERLEYPYYLSNKLNELKIMIREIVKTNKGYDAGFVLGIIRQSKYLEFMQEQFKEDLKKNIMDELRNSYPPLTDPFFVKVIGPSLDMEKIACPVMSFKISEMERWYSRYERDWDSSRFEYEWHPRW